MICSTIALFWLCTHSVSEFTDISGIAKMKKKNSPKPSRLKSLYPFVIVEEKNKQANKFFLGFSYASMLLHEFTRHVEFQFQSVLC